MWCKAGVLTELRVAIEHPTCLHKRNDALLVATLGPPFSNQPCKAPEFPQPPESLASVPASVPATASPVGGNLYTNLQDLKL